MAIVIPYFFLYVIFSIIGLILSNKASAKGKVYCKAYPEPTRARFKSMFYTILFTSVIIFLIHLMHRNDSLSSVSYGLITSLLIPFCFGLMLNIKAKASSNSLDVHKVSEAYYYAAGAYNGIWLFPFFGLPILMIISVIF